MEKLDYVTHLEGFSYVTYITSGQNIVNTISLSGLIRYKLTANGTG